MAMRLEIASIPFAVAGVVEVVGGIKLLDETKMDFWLIYPSMAQEAPIAAKDTN